MVVAVSLAVMGLILIYLEFFLPGGIFAIGGILLLLSSLFTLIVQKIQMIYFVVYTCLLILVAFSIIKLAINRVKAIKRVCQESEIEEESSELIGEVGVATTDLKPHGQISINDFSYTASCDSFIQKGAKIQIVDIKGSNFIVKELKETIKSKSSS